MKHSQRRPRPGDRQASLASPPLPTTGPLLALDLGAINIGVACCDPAQTVAHPVTTLRRRRGKRFPLQALRPHVEACAPVGVVVGLPLDADGGEPERATEARAVGALIAAKTGLPVVFCDERMTTARVLTAQRDAGVRGRKARTRIDDLAATVMLQMFLDQRTR